MDSAPAIITAIGTAIGGAVIGVLAEKRRTSSVQSKSTDAHLKTFYDTVNSMMNEQANRHSREIESLRREQADERKQWAEERKDFNGKIELLQERVRDTDKALHAKEIEVEGLRAEIRVMGVQLESYKAAPRTKKKQTTQTVEVSE